MKKFIKGVLFVIIFSSIIYTVWTWQGRISEVSEIYPRYVLSEVENFGENTGHGNLLALSPYVHPYDFSSEAAFYNMMSYYFRFAQKKKLLNDSTIVILPEYLGTWLVAVNEKKALYKDTSVTDAMQRIALSNIWSFGWAYLNAKGKNKAEDAVFRMKATKMLDAYQHTFTKLAKEFGVTIVAGSIVLPQPEVKDGIIIIHNGGKLYNISAVFDRNGKVLAPLTRKKALIEKEKSFTENVNSSTFPVYTTIAGKLGVLISTDAWFPENYATLQKKHATLLSVPAFSVGNNAWDSIWKGYDGGAPPADIEINDIRKITQREALLKYAMTGRVNTTPIKKAVSVFLQGDLWNMGTDGNTLIWNIDKPIVAADSETQAGSLINVWL